MALKKEYKDKNDNLYKKESNLKKNTKDVKSVSDKAFLHSKAKIGDNHSIVQDTNKSTKTHSQHLNSKLVDTDTQSNSAKLHSQHSNNKSVSTHTQYNSAKLHSQHSNSKLVDTDTQSNSAKLHSQHSNSKLVDTDTQSNSAKLHSQHSNSKLVDTDTQSNSAKLHSQHSNSKLVDTDTQSNSAKLHSQHSNSKLVDTDTQSNSAKLHSQHSNSKLVDTDTQSNSAKLHSQHSNSKLVDTDTQSNSAKLHSQHSNSKLVDTDTQSNSLKKATGDVASRAIKNNVEKYKQALERDEDGVKVVNRVSSNITQASKKTYKLVNNKMAKGKVKTAKLKEAKNVLREQIKQDKKDFKQTKSNIKKENTKLLIKDTKQIDQAKKKLKSQNKNLKNKKSDLKLTKKELGKNSFIKKVSKPPAAISSNVTKNGISNYKKQLEGNEGTEVVSKGITLTKEGSNALKRARKAKKHTKNQEKLKNLSTKLTESNKTSALKKGNKNKLQKNKKTQLKKKTIKKKMYANKGKKKTLTAFSGGVKNTFNNIKNKVTLAALKKVIGTKVAVGAGAIFIKLIPILLIFILLFGVIALFTGGGGYEEQLKANIGTSKNLSPEVEKWRDLVTTKAESLGMGDYVSLILAIIQVESGGTGTKDIMQSSESAGYPPNYFQSEEKSIDQGIKYLRSIVNNLKIYNNGYENNVKLIAQSYNFGSAFSAFVGNLGGEYDLSVAESYSRDVVAPSLGNTTGETYEYVNEVSKSLGKTYLYRNGGNYMYGDLVAQFIGTGNISGDFATVIKELEKYNGWSYVWGGKNPSTGFDCSGFVSWGLQQIGISLPSPASEQYNNTVAIDESEAQPGDLIFFKGTYGNPNHVSHVGFYIDENTMFDANGSGIGYHNWKTPYWQSYYAGIRRVVK